MISLCNLDEFALLPDALIFLGFFVGLYFFFQESKVKKKKLPLPPGPWGLPLLGYLPWLDSKAPYETLSRLVDKYGRMYSLKLGAVRAIVISEPDLLRKVLSMEETTGRAPLYLTHGIMQGYGLICAEGGLWKEHRKFVLGFMRNTGMKSPLSKGELQDWVAKTAEELVRILSDCPDDGLDVNPLLMHYLGNTMNELIFGLHYEETDPTWLWLRGLLEEGIKLIAVTGPINFLPWLRFLPNLKKDVTFIKENQIKTHEEYKNILRKKETNFESSEQRRTDLFQEYIKERRHRGASNLGSFDDQQIFHVAADMFGAGTETTLTTLRWHLLDLALDPVIQNEMREELYSIAEDVGFIRMEKVSSFPVCVSALMETQRLRSIIPTGIPHGVLQDIEIEGYLIPKGSMIMPLIWRIHRDEKFWQDPLNFKPKRFLDSEGQIKKMSAFMPFQTGRRMCIGDDFAKMVILTFVSKILWNFQISVSEGVTREELEKEPLCGLTLIPKPFNLLFTPIKRENKC